jgi:isoprenylcysteine carboxyl methyltransferase (ICMT) family protein YpbQ
MNKYLSLIFPIFLLTGIIILTYYRFYKFNLICLIMISIYILWILFELLISKKDFNDSNHKTDLHTREIYALSQGLTVLSALYFYKELNVTNGQIIGFTIFVSGMLLRICSIYTLGHYYSHNIRIVRKHMIINRGPYSIIRHPAYSGMILIHAGITILMFNYVTISVIFLLLIPSILLRIRMEEKVLFKIQNYAKYACNKKRLIPFIW